MCPRCVRDVSDMCPRCVRYVSGLRIVSGACAYETVVFTRTMTARTRILKFGELLRRSALFKSKQSYVCSLCVCCALCLRICQCGGAQRHCPVRWVSLRWASVASLLVVALRCAWLTCLFALLHLVARFVGPRCVGARFMCSSTMIVRP